MREVSPSQTPKQRTVQEKKSQDDQIDRHQEVETVDDNELNTDWWDNHNICVQYVNQLQEIFDTLAKFQQIWKRLLDRFNMAKNCMDLASHDLRLVNSVRYCSGPKAREFEKFKSAKFHAWIL